MKKSIILSLSILPLILLSFFWHKTIAGIIHFEKDFYFVTFVSIIILTLFFSIKNWSLNTIDLTLLLFTTYIVLNNYSSINYSTSLIKIICLLGFYLVLKQFLMNSLIRLKIISIILILCFTLYTLHGFLQNYNLLAQTNSINKVSGYYSNPAPYVALLIALIGFPLAKISFRNKTITNKYYAIIEYLLFILVLIGIATIIFTKSRAAYVALIVGLITMLIFKTELINKIKIRLNMTKRMLLIVLSASFIILLVLLYFLRPDSAYGRLVIWKIALLEMYSEKPILGHGIDAFQHHYMYYQAQYFKNNFSPISEFFSVANTPYPFNEFIKILVEEGIIGFLLFLTIIISLFYFGIQKLKVTKDLANKGILSGAIFSLTTIVVFSNFSYPFHDITFQIIFYVIIAIISSQLSSITSFKVTKASTFILSTMFSVLIFFFSKKQFIKYKAYNIWREYNYFNQNLEGLENINPLFKNQGLFYIDYADALYENDQKNKAIQILEEGKIHTSNPTLYMKLGRFYDEGMNNIEQAELAYKQVSFSIPYKFYPKYRLLKMYERNDLKQKAYLIAKEINEMPIKINSEALQNMIDEADKVIKEYEN